MIDKHIFEKPGQGVHAARIGPFAAVNTIGGH